MLSTCTSVNLRTCLTRRTSSIIGVRRVQIAKDARKNIIGMTIEELEKDMIEMGVKQKYRAHQVYSQIFNGVEDFQHLTNLPRSLRDKLSDKYRIYYGTVKEDQLAEDGTRKWLIDFDGDQVETVFIPESKRGTLCVSSQVGCTLSCAFCHTGLQPVKRNLKVSEILGQLFTAKKLLYDIPTQVDRVVSNVVFMGQGEPFYNYLNVRRSIEFMAASNGFKISKRRITVSTSGVVPKIKKLGDETGVNLAISLHACDDKLRDILVPINKQWPIKELMDALKSYPASPNQPITFEYIMIKDVNDTITHAKSLVALLKESELDATVNLIPYNPVPGIRFETSLDDTILDFANVVNGAGVRAPVRWPRGRDIMAACGQLSSLAKKKSPMAQTLEDIDNNRLDPTNFRKSAHST